MSDYNRHKWAMEWMHGGGRDPNGRSLDDEIRIGKEDWLKSQQVTQDERIGFDSGQLVQPGPGRQGYGGPPVYAINEENFKLLDDLIPNTELTINEIKVENKYLINELFSNAFSWFCNLFLVQ